MSFAQMFPTICAQAQLFYINGSHVAPHANQTLADSGYSTYEGSSASLEPNHSPWSVQIYYPQTDSNGLGQAGSLVQSASSFYQTLCHETNGVESYLPPLDSSTQILSVKSNESLRSHRPEDIAYSRKRHHSNDSVGFGEHPSRKPRQSKDSIGDGECSTRKLSPTAHRNSTGDPVSRRHSTSRHITTKLSRRYLRSRDSTGYGDHMSRRRRGSRGNTSHEDRFSRRDHGSRDSTSYGNRLSRNKHRSRNNTSYVDQLSRRRHGSRDSTSNEDRVSRRQLCRPIVKETPWI
ncbi:hypothetical protein PoB_000412700 [Plakobranchus ocellatus]|uniref:Uncharacterized protein n=1 Tax=Plakobranchus ocellatus TaxID=259542 RepID=A0AAV3Y5A8_9GAST|nr:hypothetical protein PoB_000412700 [Plakobranchus ocellatus]